MSWKALSLLLLVLSLLVLLLLVLLLSVSLLLVLLFNVVVAFTIITTLIVISHFVFIQRSSHSTAHVFCHSPNMLLEVKYGWMMVHNAHETCQKEHHECSPVVGLGQCR